MSETYRPHREIYPQPRLDVALQTPARSSVPALLRSEATDRTLQTMKPLPFSLAILCLLSGPLDAAEAPRTPPRPNIVYILADDLGYGDLGCYNKDSEDPHAPPRPAGGRGDAVHRRARTDVGLHPDAVRDAHGPIRLALAAASAGVLGPWGSP